MEEFLNYYGLDIKSDETLIRMCLLKYWIRKFFKKFKLKKDS